MAERKCFKTLAVGITGGIGSGKTEVCKIFQEYGALNLSADLIASEVIDTNQVVRRKIINTFGKDAYLSDGKLNRFKIANLIFSNPSLQKKLNSIVHPIVINQIDHQIKHIKRNGKHPLIVLEAALIYEAGAESLFDYLIVVDANEKSRIKRIMKRDGTTRDEVVARINSQWSQSKKIKQAHFVLRNDVSHDQLREKCALLWGIFYKLASVD